jgi:hypothetical protein
LQFLAAMGMREIEKAGNAAHGTIIPAQPVRVISAYSVLYRLAICWIS